MSDCVQYPLIITSTGLTSRVLFDSMVENCRNILNIAAELNSYELIPGLVKNTENIGFIISTGDTADYLIESLNMIPIDNPLKRTVPIVCAQLKNRSLSTAAAQFINYVSEDLNSVSQIYDHSSN
jgi:LysR substrate binding domain.